MRYLRPYIPALFLVLALSIAGCSSLPVPGMTTAAPRQNVPFESMPADAAVITSATAVQCVTPPLEQSGPVRFAPAASGTSDTLLAAEGFAFTGGTMHAHRAPAPGAPGLVAGRIIYTCPLGRTAEFLFLTEYEKQGNDYLVRSLQAAPLYSDTPRVNVFVLPLEELVQAGTIRTHTGLATLLAGRAVSPGALQATGDAMDIALIAISQQRVAPGSELTLGISAGSAGMDSYTEGCTTYGFNGWPAAVITGRLDPLVAGPLFAKVTFKDGQSRFGRTKLLCTHQLTGL